MRRIRILPALLIDKDGRLVKTVRFGKRSYIGDPINAVKIFNDKGVDELILLDIDATRLKREPNFALIEEIASEAFMPIGYGGGITSVAQMNTLLRAGAEKVVLNSALRTNPQLIREAAQRFGSQSVVVSIDVRRTMFKGYQCYTNSGSRRLGDPVTWSKECEELGAGELLVTSISNEGTYRGYDSEIVKKITEGVRIPVVANGGASGISDFLHAVSSGGCSAVAASSIFIFAAQGEGVLIRFPDEAELTETFWSRVEQ
jgi:imidazole glycerol-phosphate synthase subunit HisF